MIRSRGITLVEMVVVITILGVLSVIGARLVDLPVRAGIDMSRRSDLSDDLDVAMSRIRFLIRNALPNSVRVSSSGLSVEFLPIETAGRYRQEDDPAGMAGGALDFTKASDTFEVIGELWSSSSITVSGSGKQSDCISGVSSCLVIYNTGQAGASAWLADNIANIDAVDPGPPATISFSNSTDRPTWKFPYRSPGGRFYVAGRPITFHCDLPGSRLLQVDGYPVSATQGDPPAGNMWLLAGNVVSCRFSYAPGTATRNGLLSVDLTLSRDGEKGRLFGQIQVPNTP